MTMRESSCLLLAALLVAPPKGLEVGYVPIATRWSWKIGGPEEVRGHSRDGVRYKPQVVFNVTGKTVTCRKCQFRKQNPPK